MSPPVRRSWSGAIHAEKRPVPIDALAPVVEGLLGEIQAELFTAARRMLDEHTAEVESSRHWQRGSPLTPAGHWPTGAAALPVRLRSSWRQRRRSAASRAIFRPKRADAFCAEA